jgi:hypothetical protein
MTGSYRPTFTNGFRIRIQELSAPPDLTIVPAGRYSKYS